MSKLLTSTTIGTLKLKNRMVMSPMTRCRAGEGGVPTSMNANYYQQRASAGLIVAEGTQISAQGVGYPATPGIHTPAQIAGWKLVTDAVHSAGGLIFLQLWHCGRVSHSFFHEGALPVSPSPVAINGKTLQFRGEKRAKEISLMRELGLSTDSTSLSPGDVTDDEDIAVEQAE